MRHDGLRRRKTGMPSLQRLERAGHNVSAAIIEAILADPAPRSGRGEAASGLRLDEGAIKADPSHYGSMPRSWRQARLHIRIFLLKARPQSTRPLSVRRFPILPLLP